jgi:hypothetical protein
MEINLRVKKASLKNRKKNIFQILIFSFSIILTTSCIELSSKTDTSGPNTGTTADEKVYKTSVDSNGREFVAIMAKETHNLSGFLNSHRGKSIRSFKIIRPSGEIHFEASGGLPHWSNFSLPKEESPYTVQVTTKSGEVYIIKI